MDATDRFRVVIVGAGRIGTALALLLRDTAEFDVLLVDPTEPGQARAAALGLGFSEIDPNDGARFDGLLATADAVVAALPTSATPMVAAAARRCGIHYLDLGDDGATLEAVRREAETAPGCFVAQCGISPGLMSSLVLDLASRCGEDAAIDVRIGGLPQEPTGRLGYGLIWDVDASLREYTQPSAALIAGKPARLTPMSELAPLHLDGQDYEVFVSGSIPATLCARLEGRVDRLVSWTIRHPGHADAMTFLLDELKLRDRIYLLRNLLLNALPEIADDRLLISISAAGRLSEQHFRRIVEPAAIGGTRIGAMRRTAASHLAAVLDLLRLGLIAKPSLNAQEDIPLARLRDNRFLSWFLADTGQGERDERRAQ